MKRLAFIMMALLLALMPAAAQNYRDSRYYNSKTDRLDYRYNHNYGSPYYGFRIGCGIGYDMFYADLTYDIGLANICHDSFDKSRNGALQLNFGVNF